ncbi:MAG: HAD-IB family hydrolase [Proteobacteria bacterium]|nr:HAD-IB family hydrolase [Pseudomonadota bacterium]
MKIHPLCFFDMDRTLIATNSGVSFMRYSLRRGKTSRWKVFRSMLDYMCYRFDLLDMDKAYRDSLKLLVGVREEELIQFCQEWFEEVVRNFIYPQAFDFVRQHKARGETVVIISNATTYAVQPLAHHLEVGHILGTRLEVCKGRFTGNYIEPLCFRSGKIFWAEKLICELGGEFNASTFYTDSITDLPLLERVKHPRIVNPDSKLRALAKKRGWPIHDFRLPKSGEKVGKEERR